MLPVEKVDLASVAEALEDHSPDTSWWFDPETGEAMPMPDGDPGAEFIAIAPLPSAESYRDMEEFTERVRDPRARELLVRALAGRGAFRRFKDTLFEFPELRETWFRFHDVRMERRALRWLAEAGFIAEDEAERGAADRPDHESPLLGRPFDAEAVARAVARDLKKLYGDRLRDVVLYGSWARGDAHPESDIDLVVVLDSVESRYTEQDAMDKILWTHSLENETVVSAHPVSERDYDAESMPFLANARREGRSVA